MISIEQMATTEGIPEKTIRRCLEIFEPVSTPLLKRARDAYESAAPGSDEKKRALILWHFSCLAIRRARKAYENAPRGSRDAALALAVWRTFFIWRTVGVITIDQARDAYKNAAPESDEKRQALVTLAQFYRM